MKKVLALYVCCCGLLKSFSGIAASLPVKTYTVCGQKVKLEIAQSPEERERGLMNRSGLKPGKGMMFVFERSQPLQFWMKNVPFDLDIGFFDAHGVLLNAHTMVGTSPLQRDAALPRYESLGDAQYAVELSAGFFKDKKSCRVHPLPAQTQKTRNESTR